jgi:hypothetical protein
MHVVLPGEPCFVQHWPVELSSEPAGKCFERAALRMFRRHYARHARPVCSRHGSDDELACSLSPFFPTCRRYTCVSRFTWCTVRRKSIRHQVQNHDPHVLQTRCAASGSSRDDVIHFAVHILPWDVGRNSNLEVPEMPGIHDQSVNGVALQPQQRALDGKRPTTENVSPNLVNGRPFRTSAPTGSPAP